MGDQFFTTNQNFGSDMMWNYGFGPGMMGWFGWGGMLMGLIFLLILIMVVIILTRSIKGGSLISPTADTPLDILKKRYAKGEISKDDFDRIKKDL
ncbi:MAG: SHOCT domain-containing protein [Brevinematales bacterium]|jgi:putative membrane protein